MKYIASISFGKDSLAMLLIILEKKMPLDEVIFFDTGMEFQAIYNIREKVKKILSEKGIKFTQLEMPMPFEFLMFDKEVKERKGGTHKGYSWCGGLCRWGTSMKLQAINKYCKTTHTQTHTQYVGIAFDEQERLKKERKGFKSFPLADLKMTEKDALKYCRERGWDWKEDDVDLYDVLDRVSCWCCANKNNKELRNYRKYLPKYWDKMKRLQEKTERPFKGIGIFKYEQIFSEEEINQKKQVTLF